MARTAVGPSTLGPWVPKLVLCNVCLATVPFKKFVGAAAAAGFDAISVLARAHRRADATGSPIRRCAS